MITLKENALAEIRRRALVESPASPIVRLGVKEGGCAGTTYVLEFTDEVAAGDQTFSQEEFTVVVDEASFALLKGLEVDFVDSLVGGGFRFNNPNATGTCGCGSSFKVAQQLQELDQKGQP